jgi:prepilin-type N-terminal cleavage/methylation domain-containing protein
VKIIILLNKMTIKRKNIVSNKRWLVSSGYTLIELVLVMAIVGILATTMMVIIKPATMLARARDSQRDTDISSIVMLVRQYASDHSGTLPDTDGNPNTSNFPTSLTCIGTNPACYNLAAAGDDDESLVPDYSASLPKDPKTGTAANIGYSIMVDAYNHITASASGETRTISMTK